MDFRLLEVSSILSKLTIRAQVTRHWDNRIRDDFSESAFLNSKSWRPLDLFLTLLTIYSPLSNNRPLHFRRAETPALTGGKPKTPAFSSSAAGLLRRTGAEAAAGREELGICYSPA